jgi:GntR family transcriptional repressor for pyruvate dehydrogenase complex
MRISGDRVNRPPKLQALVADRLQQMVLDGSWRRGTKLPAERLLCEQLGVSRTVLRESISILRARGVLKDVPGKGTFVWQNVTEPLKELLSLFVSSNKLDGSVQLFEVRTLLEVEIAGLAAERASPSDIAELEKINDGLGRMNRIVGPWTEDRVRRYNDQDFDFHLKLAKSTKNELFAVLLTALTGSFLDSWDHLHNQPETRRQGIQMHQRILKAVRAKDPRAARKATRNNLKAFLKASLKE